jgi:hypothetical protein
MLSSAPVAGTASTTPSKAPASGSPRASQPPLFSTTTSNNAGWEGSSPSVNRVRPPAFVPRTPYTPATSAQGSTPSKQGGTSAVRPGTFQTPQTPGVFKSAASQLYRPYSTPSAASPAPTPGSSGPVPMSLPGEAAGSAPLNRRFHTRPVSMTASSPNFYSAYKSAQQSGAGDDAEHSVTAATAATAHMARTAGSSQFASPPPKVTTGAGSVHSPLPAGTPAVSLSAEDQEACAQLLLSQTQLLEKAQKELQELEEKLRGLKDETRVRI